MTSGVPRPPLRMMAPNGAPMKKTQMLALNIYETFYGRTGFEGVGQAKAVVFFIIVVAIALVQLTFTRSKEVEQ